MADASSDAGVALAPAPAAACRIYRLHDELLLRVLSHLDAVQVVQTSVLSRRWRGLWRSVPRVNATYKEFDAATDDDEERDVMFKAFVNRFLMLRNPIALDEFRLAYSFDGGSDGDDDANLWIQHALQCNARSVQLNCLGSPYEVNLKNALLASKCSLTSLQLHYVFLDKGFFRSLQMGCALLERLTLHQCLIYDPDISSQTLKVLTIYGDDCLYTNEGQATISIPSLIHLHFSPPVRVPLLNNMELLATASVSVRDGGTQVDDIHSFLVGLSGVTDLEFNYHGRTLTMGNDLHWCPKFNNLTKLTLGEWCQQANFYALIVFLQNSPNLMKLTLKFVRSGGGRLLGELEERSFTCTHLQTVCLQGSMDDFVINSMKKFFLDNGITSDQIHII